MLFAFGVGRPHGDETFPPFSLVLRWQFPWRSPKTQKRISIHLCKGITVLRELITGSWMMGWNHRPGFHRSHTLQRHPTRISLRQSLPPSPCWKNGSGEAIFWEATSWGLGSSIMRQQKSPFTSWYQLERKHIYSLEKQNCFVNRESLLFSNLHNCEIFSQKSLENKHTILIVLDHYIVKYLG